MREREREHVKVSLEGQRTSYPHAGGVVFLVSFVLSCLVLFSLVEVKAPSQSLTSCVRYHDAFHAMHLFHRDSLVSSNWCERMNQCIKDKFAGERSSRFRDRYCDPPRWCPFRAFINAPTGGRQGLSATGSWCPHTMPWRMLSPAAPSCRWV